MIKTRDPARRRMLEEMIAYELEAIKRRALILAPGNRNRPGSIETA